MRRLISYIMLSLSMLICVGVAFTPVFTSMKPGREYTSGNEIVYQLRSTQTDDEGNHYDISENDTGIDSVVSEMKSRLEDYGIEDYSVKVEGNDSIRVSVSLNDTNELNYVRKYLAFSGKDFSLTNSKDARVDQEDLLGDKEAYIVREQDVFPYLIIPVNNTEKVRTLVDDVADSSTSSSDTTSNSINISRANEEIAEESQSTPTIYLWSNIDENTPNYSEVSKDTLYIEKHLIRSFVSTNFWYEKSTDEKTEIAILFGSATEDDNSYDTTKLEEANKEANYYLHLLNASSYDYFVDDLFVTESSSGITYNSITSTASLENLLSFSNDVNVALSLTLISTLLAIIIVTLILVLFYRINALGMVANTLTSIFLTYLLFSLMKSTFNIGAVVGGILLAITSLILEIFYANKFKEEVYKGRSIKKAMSEATNKINLISIDIAVITAFSGLMLYFLGGNALKSMGVVLFFGAIVCLLMNLLIFRLLNWLIANETGLQKNYAIFNINEKNVPSVTETSEKQIFEGSYQNKDFTKHKKAFGISALVLLLASITGFSVFGALNGSALNTSKVQSDSTIVYVSIKGDNIELDSTDIFKSTVLSQIEVNGQKLIVINEDGSLTNNQGVKVTAQTRTTYNYETTTSTNYNYYIVTLDTKLNNEELLALEDNFQNVIMNEEIKTEQDVSVSAKNTHETVNTPSQMWVAIAVSISIAGSALYIAFRYKPTKGLTVLLTSSAASAITFGILTLTRIPTSAITTLVLPIVSLLSILTSLYFLNKQKDLLKEEKSDISLEEKSKITVKSIAISATPLLVVSIICGYISINYLGFGPISLAVLFGGMLLGVVISLIINLVILGPLSDFFTKQFKNIKLPKFKRSPKKERIKLQGKKNSSEPEETIFIGIND